MPGTSFYVVGPGRFREHPGLFYEQFALGQRFAHRPGMTLSQQDNADETLDSYNSAMVHFDARYAGQSSWKRPLLSTSQMSVYFTVPILSGAGNGLGDFVRAEFFGAAVFVDANRKHGMKKGFARVRASRARGRIFPSRWRRRGAPPKRGGDAAAPSRKSPRVKISAMP